MNAAVYGIRARRIVGRFRLLLAGLALAVFGVSAQAESAESVAQETEVITLRHCMSGGDSYIEGLLRLALSTPERTVNFQKLQYTCSQLRQIDFIYRGETDFMWGGTTAELESKLIPVRIPLFKGLLGHRILIVRQEDLHSGRFDGIENLKDLTAFRVGQGRTWSDTPILQAAGFNVVTSSGYRNLFLMLDKKRFDIFPRALVEPWQEVSERPDLKLAVESNLAIVYPMPAYIFVSPDKPELAGLIEESLNRAIADGRFDNYFYNNPAVSEALNRTELKNRKVFYLNNPFLPQNTPFHRPELWLNDMQEHYVFKE